MPKAHGKSKKRLRSPPSRWESEASDGDDAVEAEARLERRTRAMFDMPSASRGKDIRHDARPSSAKEKATLRMKDPELQPPIRWVSSPYIRSVTHVGIDPKLKLFNFKFH